MKRHLWFFALVLLFNTACSSLVVRLPSARLESPEVAGPWGKRLGVVASEMTAIKVTEDASARPPALNAPTTWAAIDVPMKAGLGIGDFFEVGLRFGPFSNSGLLTGKFQALGNSARASQPGDFALAFSAGFGSQTSTNSGDQKGEFGPGGHNWQAKETTSIVDFALILGYRFTPWFMMYGGPYLSRLSMSGNVHDDLSDDGTSPAADYALSADGQISGVNVDFEVTFTQSKVFSLTAEVAYLTVHWTNLPTTTAGRVALLSEWVF